MTSKFRISRREFLKVSTIAAAGVVVGACAKRPEAPKEEPTATPKPAEAQPTATPVPAEEPAGGEAPMLADMVTSGAIPSLDERLPAEPMALEVVEGIGQYGGTLTWWQRGTLPSRLQLMNFDENLLKYSREGTTAQRPNLLTGCEKRDQ